MALQLLRLIQLHAKVASKKASRPYSKALFKLLNRYGWNELESPGPYLIFCNNFHIATGKKGKIGFYNEVLEKSVWSLFSGDAGMV